MISRIAIVGVGGVFPAMPEQTPDLRAFWDNVKAARSTSRRAPQGRWVLDVDDALGGSPDHPEQDKVYSSRGCYIDDWRVDRDGLNIDKALLDELDPVFHLALRAGREAFVDGNGQNIDRSRMGAILGAIALPTDASSRIAREVLGRTFEHRLTGRVSPLAKATHPFNRHVAALPGGLLASALGLGCGAYTLDAACASSLYALKLACDELLAGRADAMLAGGVSRPDCLYTQMGFSQLRALSLSGVCSPFDAKADGLVVGEGAGIVMLKRLPDALRDGDRIYAVIAGAGLSNDIGGSLFAPDSEGQLRAMRAAYKQAGWSPRDIDLVECHGTGTPTGDAVELQSLQKLWSEAGADDNGRCVIGSVKSNVGHLLTGAGGAGLIKTLLAMRDETLPPTANFQNASSSLGAFRVIGEAEPWDARKRDEPRRAAVSAFGFGGINAHVLLEQWTDGRRKRRARKPRKPPSPRVAIVGMSAHFGPWSSLDRFAQRVLGDASGEKPRAFGNAWGVYDSPWYKGEKPHGFNIETLRIALDRFRIPPAELKQMLPQQLLMLQVAAAALDDANLINHDHLQTGVYVGIELDPNTTNFHFRWSLANEAKRLAPPDMDEGDLAAWTQQLRDAAHPPLTADRTMGALGGIVASRVARAFRVGGPSFTISASEASGVRALEAAVRALQRGELELAVVGAVDLASDVRNVLTMEDRTQLIGDGATSLVLKRYDEAKRDGDRIYAAISGIGVADELAAAGERACDDARVAAEDAEVIAPAAKAIGYTGAADGLATVTKAALALYHQVKPADKGAAQYWLHDRADGPRRASVEVTSLGSGAAHVVLEEHVSDAIRPDQFQPLGPPEAAVLIVEGADGSELLSSLAKLRKMATDPIHATARRWWSAHRPDAARAMAVTFVARDKAQFVTLIDDAEHTLKVWPDRALNGPDVFYTPKPLAREGDVAFVYPGSGSHFANMGRDLAAQWPAALRGQHLENERLSKQWCDGLLWNDPDMVALADDHEAVIFGQVTLGTLCSDTVKLFGLKPNAIIGYSLGETAGFFSTRTWIDRDEMLRRMHESTLFTEDLAGPCESVREAWDLPDDETVDWSLGVIDRSGEQVKAALVGRRRVYLLIVNTPHECVIGGQREAVQALCKDLGCNYHEIRGVTTVHCEVAEPVATPYRDLHLFTTQPPRGVTFYSGVWGKSYEVTRDTAADSILQQALRPFDYTKVIESAYGDGVRLFFEMGPGASCSRMIGRILGDRAHVAMSACTAGHSAVVSVLRMVACAAAHRAAVDLAMLYDRPSDDEEGRGPALEVTVGGDTFEPPKMPSEVKKVEARAERVEPQAFDPGRRSAMPRLEGAWEQTVVRESVSPAVIADPVVAQMVAVEAANAAAHEAYLTFANQLNETMKGALAFEMGSGGVETLSRERLEATNAVAFDRAQCMAIAIGKIGDVLGEAFAPIDQHPTRVRLPDEPLMLVDRILTIEGEPLSMTSGRVVTEHDVLPGAWYLDNGRIPTCVAVEAGQADLFLSGYLGIDFVTQGHAMYRLLDAEVTFHAPLPTVGKTIHYDIHIDGFFNQGDTHLFRFWFEATVDGKPLLSMRKGIAGFFTQSQLAAGQGIVHTELDLRPMPGKRPNDWKPLAPMAKASYSDAQVERLREGDLAGCFGDAFKGLPLRDPVKLPGAGDSLMRLADRVLDIDPTGGRFGLGQITAEADIEPDDWFLTCHFVDDKVMPGTLMYECCMHTLRIYLMRMGWVGEHVDMAHEPLAGEPATLKCRGQVIETTKKVTYRISVKELGYLEDEAGTPYCIADALMYADGKAIVEIGNMSVRLSGLTRAGVERLWEKKSAKPQAAPAPGSVPGSIPASVSGSAFGGVTGGKKPAIYDYDRILAFAIGKPSQAFGSKYKVFDEQRVIARLPGPPYDCMHRVTDIADAEPWVLKAGAKCEAQYDVPAEAWYFTSDRQATMPYAILLETALQPCGWLAAYLGSALHSDTDVHFRNLGGKATQHRLVTQHSGTLTTQIEMTNVSESGGMIIEHFTMKMFDREGLVFDGTTYFGFFSGDALANQVGLRDYKPYIATAAERARTEPFAYPRVEPFPDDMLGMIDQVTVYDRDGGPHGLGVIEGTLAVDPGAWFFKAHFYQDPVCPGSLGLESYLQLLKIAAMDRFGGYDAQAVTFQTMIGGGPYEWIYRGQVIPSDKQVTVQAVVTEVDEQAKMLRANGFLSVDGRNIYQMIDFTTKLSTHLDQ